jgi:hypothetical protein
MNTCCYHIMRDGDVAQSECGAPATHRAAKNPRLFLCEMHAHDVGKRFKIRELPPQIPISQVETTPTQQ